MINLVYVAAGHTTGAPHPDSYNAGLKRFLDTYASFDPGTPHRLVIVNSRGALDDPERKRMIERAPSHTVIPYEGDGWDIGAQQFAASSMDPGDWFVGFSSWAFFTRAGWLARYRLAIDGCGDTLYGSMISFENSPHIRGTGYCCMTARFQKYPKKINTRADTFRWESGDWSFTRHFAKSGAEPVLVTWDGCYPMRRWREASHTFRQGNQSNLINHDKHSQVYESGTQEERRNLEARSYPYNGISARPGKEETRDPEMESKVLEYLSRVGTVSTQQVPQFVRRYMDAGAMKKSDQRATIGGVTERDGWA